MGLFVGGFVLGLWFCMDWCVSGVGFGFSWVCFLVCDTVGWGGLVGFGVLLVLKCLLFDFYLVL